MNRDDIIRMARECGLTINHQPMLGVEHFAALVAQAEREECALLSERHANEWRHLGGLVGPTAEDIAARIRARGESLSERTPQVSDKFEKELRGE